MNADQLKGKAMQVKGKLKQAFSRLGEDDFALYAEGQRDEFMGKVQEKYGIAREDAERRIDEIEKANSDVAGGY